MNTQTKEIRLLNTSLRLNIDWNLVITAVSALGITLLLTLLMEGVGANLFA